MVVKVFGVVARVFWKVRCLLRCSERLPWLNGR